MSRSTRQGPVIHQPSSPVPPPGPEPFYWLNSTRQVSLEPETRPSLPPPLPDLSIQWIERTPHYHRYCVDYGRGLPELCAGTENDKRFPDPGEVVTFTAQIANQGVITSPAVTAIWTVGQIANLPASFQPLAPGITTTLSITWPWPSDPLTVTLSLDPANTLVETTRANNRAPSPHRRTLSRRRRAPAGRRGLCPTSQPGGLLELRRLDAGPSRYYERQPGRQRLPVRTSRSGRPRADRPHPRHRRRRRRYRDQHP